MFSIFGKIIDTLRLGLRFNWVNSPSSKLKLITKRGDNIGRDKNVYLPSGPGREFVEVVYSWSVPEQHQENQEIIVYEFSLTLLNKGEQIIKDLWVNFSTSGFNLEIEETQQTD